MKRRTKIGWLGLLLAMIATVCAACSIPGVGEVELTKLTAPEIRVEDGVVSWNSVPNASGYIVRINGREDTTAELNYRIASLVSESGEVLVKVKARGSALYAESDWSAEVAYQYVKDSSSGEDMFEELQPYGIGYGYNVITKEYFNIEEREKTAAILDTKALAETCRLVESKTNQGLAGSLIESNIESMSVSVRNKFFQKQIFEETGADVYDSFLSDYVSTELKQYTVTFMDEDGMTPLSEAQCYFGTTVPASSVPGKEQYVCTGWYTDPGLTQPFDPLTEGVRKDLTLYGKWEPLTYTVSFAGTGIPDQEVGEAQGFLVQRPADPQLEGQLFQGWYADAEYTAEFDFSKPIVRDTTVYAKWDNDISYEITYVLNGGENDPDNGGVYNILNLPVPLYQPTRFGYDFLGWYFSADFSGDPVTRLEKGLTGDITLHARWEVRTSVIRFVNAEGSTPDPITVTYGQAFDLPHPSHRGNAGKHAVYQFEGWYSGSLFDPESWDFTDPATGAFASELTLNAGWTRSPEFAAYTLIDSETDFRAIANDLSGKYLLTADIDFAGTPLDPFGTFNGILLGNGHTLKNLKIDWTENQTTLTVGLFGTNKGTIDGLRLQDPVVKVSPTFATQNITTYAGTVAGINAGTITDCRVEGLDLLANSHDIAEKFMQQYGKDPRNITQGDKLEWEKWMKQEFTGTLPSHEPNWSDLCLRVYGGGIVGSNEGTIRDVSVSGSVEVNVYNMRETQADEAHTHHALAGGIAGRNSGTITGAVNSAKVAAYLEANDIVGDMRGGIKYTLGGIKYTPAGWVYAGGIAGYNFSGQITGSSNSGSLSVRYRTFAPEFVGLIGCFYSLFGDNMATDVNIKRGTNDIAN